MPKLPVRKPKQVLKTLEKHGFILDHVTGSHYIMVHPDYITIMTIPMHNRDLSKGTLHAIIKQSGLKRTDF